MKKLLRLETHNRETTAPRYEKIQPGEVWLVGAGPGHPGMITVLGRQILQQADVVVHDRLGCEEILRELPSRIRLVDAGKRPDGGKSRRQEETNKILLEEARAGLQVVRLKGGDPFVFGRGLEEVEFLRRHGIPCRVVAGLSSALSAPAAAGVPLTHRELSRGFLVQTGRAKAGEIPPPNDGDTRVYLMAIGVMDEIAAQLIAEGTSPDTPALVISDATTYKERAVRGSLATIAEKARQAGIEPPGILVVGETAALGEEPPAARKRLLVTSTRVPPILEEFLPEKPLLWRPLTRVEPLSGPAREDSRRECHNAIETDWVVFNNRHAVKEFFALLREAGLDARQLKARLAAIGEEAAGALEELCLVPDFVAVEGNRAGIRQALLAETRGRRVLLPCSSSYAGSLRRDLLAGGVAEARLLPVYENAPVPGGEIDWRFIDSVFFASPTGARRFAEEFPAAPLESLHAVCVGESAADQARTIGFSHVRDLTESANQSTEKVNRELAI